MSNPDIPSHLKPLYANLLRISIPSFLLTSWFEHMLIENDWDQYWDGCMQAAYRSSNSVVLIPGYIGDTQYALGVFIGGAGSSEPHLLFIFISKLLESFFQHISSSCDLSSIAESLITAGYPESDTEELVARLRRIQSETSEKKDKSLADKKKITALTESQPNDRNDSLQKVIQLCSRFHLVVRQIRKRHSSRPTLDVGDEYDVQDLLHGLLRLSFDDIRQEEFSPSYAGKGTRMDFLLKREKIVIEVKMTRKGLADKELSDQLILDIARYKAHPNCKTLVCFIYDPEGRVANPKGLEADLNSSKDDLQVVLLIAPNQ